VDGIHDSGFSLLEGFDEVCHCLSHCILPTLDLLGSSLPVIIV
jgi:hypothetical protein